MVTWKLVPFSVPLFFLFCLFFGRALNCFCGLREKHKWHFIYKCSLKASLLHDTRCAAAGEEKSESNWEKLSFTVFTFATNSCEEHHWWILEPLTGNYSYHSQWTFRVFFFFPSQAGIFFFCPAVAVGHVVKARVIGSACPGLGSEPGASCCFCHK